MLGAGERSEDKIDQNLYSHRVFSLMKGEKKPINNFFKGIRNMLIEMKLTEKSSREEGMLG